MCVETTKVKCYACEGDTRNLFSGVQQCLNCGHISDYTVPIDSQGYCEDKADDKNDYREAPQEDYIRMKQRWDFVTKHASGCDSLLDFGCADNLFIKCAPAGHGFKELIPFDTNWLTGFSDERVLDRYYDVVTLWHVLEHITNPKMVTERIPHKYLFVIIPWVENISIEEIPTTRLFFHGRHVHFYTKKSFMNIFGNDYEILEESHEDGKLINLEKDIVGFAMKRKTWDDTTVIPPRRGIYERFYGDSQAEAV